MTGILLLVVVLANYPS